MNPDILITRDDLKDQKQKMVEDGVPEAQAQEIYDDMKTFVMLESQELGKNWNEEVVEAVTNILISVQRQLNENRYYRRQRFYERLYSLLGSVGIAGLAGLFAVSVYMGDILTSGVFGIMLLVLVVSYVRSH